MPYRYLDSERYEQKLMSSLERCGYEFLVKEQRYREESLKFNGVWNPTNVLVVRWERDFVSDGEDEQDLQIIITL